MTDASSAPQPPLISIEGAAFGYPPRAPVLEGVDLAIPPGDFLGVVGPNGAGKSTLLRALLGLHAPLAGVVRRAPGIRAGYVPQRQALDPIWPVRVVEVVLMGLAREIGLLRRPGAAHRARALEALAQTGMAAHAERLYRDLSGGQQQRALIARALAPAPDLLVLDEPTNDLDLTGERDVMELVRSLHEGGRAVVLVTHALPLVASYASRLALVRDGRVEAGPLDAMLTPERLSPLYGAPVTVATVAGRRVVVATGGPPS